MEQLTQAISLWLCVCVFFSVSLSIFSYNPYKTIVSILYLGYTFFWLDYQLLQEYFLSWGALFVLVEN